ncbi:protein phosphatase 2A-3 [Striga asiatica]|uniref:Protein phosphatase 2A-3 n=1 Tax=Striga asiatica TaxID=4170 RepID=A0A5A7R657_STRAF|nr:protein phosphatase 2A-3 [Striga asiatica]
MGSEVKKTSLSSADSTLHPGLDAPAQLGVNALSQLGLDDQHNAQPLAGPGGYVGWVNGSQAALLWAVVGLVSATACPVFLWDFHGSALAMTMFAVFVVTFAIYLLGFRARKSVIMRERRNWWQTIIANLALSGIMILTAYLHKASYRGMICHYLVAVAVFAFIEIGKPIFDYGFLQNYLRLPVLTAFQHYGLCVSVWHFITVGTLVFATWWQSYFLYRFDYQAPQPVEDTIVGIPDQEPVLLLDESNDHV